jgi:nitrate/nitrite transport system substrate-binding protein
MSVDLRIGHTAPLALAPLLIAAREGVFERAGVRVELEAELGLATLLAKLAEGRLDGAVLPAHLPVLAAAGLVQPRVSLVPVAACSSQGSGLVLAAPAQRHKPVRIGTSGPASEASHLLRTLASQGDTILKDATLVSASASQLLPLLSEGALDGICAADPVPMLAALASGQPVHATSASCFARHPGLVLAVRSEVLTLHGDLISSLSKAVGLGRSHCATVEPGELLRLVLGLSPYLVLDQELRARAATATPDQVGALLSTRFDLPDFAAHLDAAAATYIEQAARAALPTSARPPDLRQWVARVYRSPARA